MKKGIIIAAAVLLALIAAAGVVIATRQKEDSPPVRIIEDTMENNTVQTAQIEELRAQLEDLERRMAQQEFDIPPLKPKKTLLSGGTRTWQIRTAGSGEETTRSAARRVSSVMMWQLWAQRLPP